MAKVLSLRTASREENEELNRVLRAAQFRYGNYPGVSGIGVGVKYRRMEGKPQATDEVAIIFFIEKKEDSPSRRLPRYFYGRFRDGRVNRHRRIKTDVIQVGRVEPACRAGSDVSSFGESGTITLLFRNKLPSDPSYYLLTCSHVVGDMDYSPPLVPNLGSQCCPNVYPFAVTIKNSVIGPVMPYDIALAKVTDKALDELGHANLPQLDAAVAGTTKGVKRILPSDQIELHDEVQGAVASGIPKSGEVSALGTNIKLKYDGKAVSVSDLYTVRFDVARGDSGGLIYRNESAIGIIIARSREGWTWFHPLDNALVFLDSLDPSVALKIF